MIKYRAYRVRVCEVENYLEKNERGCLAGARDENIALHFGKPLLPSSILEFGMKLY